MIGRLRGTLIERRTDHVVIEAGGVGFVIHCSERTLASLPGVGRQAVIYTDLLVREDLLQMFGFLSARERELHRLLVTVQGVGAKAALAIVAALGVDQTIRAVVLKDADSIRSAQGVGPKLAQRVVNELQERASLLMAMGNQQSTTAGEPGDGSEEPADFPAERVPEEVAAAGEAISAMSNLGYQRGVAASAVAEVASEHPDFDTAALIRGALKRLAPG